MVRALDDNWDWTFGQGVANYLHNDDEIVQNVQTRLKSFKNDYFLNLEAGLDWWTLLSTKNSNLVQEIKNTIILTNGVLRVNNVSIVENKKRNAIIDIDFDTIFNKNLRRRLNA